MTLRDLGDHLAMFSREHEDFCDRLDGLVALKKRPPHEPALARAKLPYYSSSARLAYLADKWRDRLPAEFIAAAEAA